MNMLLAQGQKHKAGNNKILFRNKIQHDDSVSASVPAASPIPTGSHISRPESTHSFTSEPQWFDCQLAHVNLRSASYCSDEFPSLHFTAGIDFFASDDLYSDFVCDAFVFSVH